MKSWIAGLTCLTKGEEKEQKELLQQLFDKYVEESLNHMKKTFKFLIPTVEISIVISICKLLQAIFSCEVIKGLEYIFVFACVWCMGGSYSEKDAVDYRKEFSKWWKDKWKTVKYPGKGTVFDYYVDYENNKLEEWSTMDVGNIDS